MTSIELPTERFNFNMIGELIDTVKVVVPVSKVGRPSRTAKPETYQERETTDMTRVIEYCKRYFYRVMNTEGEVLVWEVDDFRTLTAKAFKNTYLDNLPADVMQIMSDPSTMYERVCDSEKPRVYATQDGRRYINTSKHHLLVAPLPEATPAGIKARDVFYRYMLTVLCNYDTKMLEYLKDWVATIVQGRKNGSALIMCGSEGIGKSTFADFLMSQLIPNQLCLSGNNELLTGIYTQPLEGMRLCVFEEMSYTPQQWMSVSSKLKTWVTEEQIMFRSMYQAQYRGRVEASFIMNSNHSSVIQGMGSGRRWVVLDASAEYANDGAYFSALRETCFNKECAAAVWHDLAARDLSGYSAQNFPETANKRDLRERNLTPAQRWVRDEFFLKGRAFDRKGIEDTVRLCSQGIYTDCEKTLRGDGRREDFYNAFACWCAHAGNKPQNKIDFFMALRQINIHEKRTPRAQVYEVDLQALEKSMKQFKLLEHPGEASVESPDITLARLQNEMMRIQHQIASLMQSAPVVADKPQPAQPAPIVVVRKAPAESEPHVKLFEGGDIDDMLNEF